MVAPGPGVAASRDASSAGTSRVLPPYDCLASRAFRPPLRGPICEADTGKRRKPFLDAVPPLMPLSRLDADARLHCSDSSKPQQGGAPPSGQEEETW